MLNVTWKFFCSIQFTIVYFNQAEFWFRVHCFIQIYLFNWYRIVLISHKFWACQVFINSSNDISCRFLEPWWAELCALFQVFSWVIMWNDFINMLRSWKPTNLVLLVFTEVIKCVTHLLRPDAEISFNQIVFLRTVLV